MSKSSAKPPTIYDVAVEAGLSHQSVSRVLRNVPGVTEETTRRVQAALRKLDYRPSVLARQLASGRARRIGVVGYESFEASTAKVLKGIDSVAAREGYALEIVNVDPLGDLDAVTRELDRLNDMDIVGVLATSPTETIRRALQRTSFRTPIYLDEHDESDVSTGVSRSGVEVMEHLLDLGHTRIAHVSGPPAWDAASLRRAAYVEALRRRGLEPMPVVEGDWTARSGFEAIQRLPLLSSGITALFVANDRMALGALGALHRLGVAVPDDVSVASIDDIPEAEYLIPALTTVHVDFEGTGRASAEALLSLIRGDATAGARPVRSLQLRNSTAQPRS